MTLRTGLEVYYKFDNDGLDNSGNGRALTYSGTEAYATGKFNNGYSLTGTDTDFATRGSNDTALDFDGGGATYTVQSWVKFNSVATIQILVEKMLGDASGLGWSMGILNDASFFFGDGVTGFMNSAASAAGTSIFHHVVARSLGGGSRELFVDGTQADTDNLNLTLTTEVLRIGERQGGQSFPLDGIIDEVAVWSRGLSNAEISALYNGGIGFAIPGTNTGNIQPKQLRIDTTFPLKPYTVANLPAPELFDSGDYLFVTDETGGSIPAFSDGTNWRRVTDRAVVS